jgi:hypothetical protein
MLLAMSRPKDALPEFETALAGAPGRRGALHGALRASELIGETWKAQQFRAALK